MMITKPGKNVLSPRAAPLDWETQSTARWWPHSGLKHSAVLKEMLKWQQQK
jgi:hypothetical protein